jgi:hypothetical protein
MTLRIFLSCRQDWRGVVNYLFMKITFDKKADALAIVFKEGRISRDDEYRIKPEDLEKLVS